MKITQIGTLETGQDVAIYGDYLFDFAAHGVCIGECTVYKMSEVLSKVDVECDAVCRFILDKTDVIIPHCNSACFGNEFYEEGDEFPLIYLNVYNNYQNAEVRNEGITCVYRITRTGESFKSELVQLIGIDFVENLELWKSLPGTEDRRPYGNFIVDRESNKYYGYVTREKEHITRYFSFDLPNAREGEIDEKFGVRFKTITESDINFYFDGEHGYMQGGCVHDGLIYSLSGGRKNPEFRIIDPETKTQKFYQNLLELDLPYEPEGIDFHNGTCYYVAGYGRTYIFEDMI